MALEQVLSHRVRGYLGIIISFVEIIRLCATQNLKKENAIFAINDNDINGHS